MSISHLTEMPLGLAIQRGNIPNFSAVNKFGFNDQVPTDWEVIALGSANFTYPTTAGVVTLVSDDANDTSAGTGARTIKIQGLDGDYNFQEETVTLNGTTNVTTTNSFLRIFRMSVETAGSSGGIEGDVTATIGGNEQSRMEADYDNQSLQANYTVPANKRAYLTRIQFTSTKDNKSAFLGLFTREIGSVFKVKQLVEIYRNSVVIDFPAPILIPEKTDIELRGKNAGTGNISIGGTFDLFLEDL
tara:strand:- start:457 stop:1191 length:735 start_codon:yes stop_codon:yes gene_type:complete